MDSPSPFVGHPPGCDGAPNGNSFSAELGPGPSKQMLLALCFTLVVHRSNVHISGEIRSPGRTDFCGGRRQ